MDRIGLQKIISLPSNIMIVIIIHIHFVFKIHIIDYKSLKNNPYDTFMAIRQSSLHFHKHTLTSHQILNREHFQIVNTIKIKFIKN